MATPARRPADPNHEPAVNLYGLAAPTLPDALAALTAVFGDAHADELWRKLLRNANLSGTETDASALDRLVETMRRADPVTALCARSLAIRSETFTRLSATYHMIRSAE